MDKTILVCILIILLIIITYNTIHSEPFSHSTNGAIQQLQAKDVQDINISVGVDRYPPLYGYQPIWNAPTRFPYLYAYPYYYYYPGIYNYYGYPYYGRRWWRW
jgi:hypothetical protein